MYVIRKFLSYYRCSNIRSGCTATAYSIKNEDKLCRGSKPHAATCFPDDEAEVIAMREWIRQQLLEKWCKFKKVYDEACEK